MGGGGGGAHQRTRRGRRAGCGEVEEGGGGLWRCEEEASGGPCTQCGGEPNRVPYPGPCTHRTDPLEGTLVSLGPVGRPQNRQHPQQQHSRSASHLQHHPSDSSIVAHERTNNDNETQGGLQLAQVGNQRMQPHTHAHTPFPLPTTNPHAHSTYHGVAHAGCTTRRRHCVSQQSSHTIPNTAHNAQH
jgi:hypothetical protein